MPLYLALAIMLAVIGTAMLGEYSGTIAEAWRLLRVGQLHLVAWIPEEAQMWTGMANSWDAVFGRGAYLEAIASHMGSAGFDPRVISMPAFDAVFWQWFSWLPGLLLALLGIRLMRRGRVVAEVHDTESLLDLQVDLYPHLKEFKGIHPEKMDLRYTREGGASAVQFGVALTPEEFARMSPPLGLEAAAQEDSSMSRPIWSGTTDFDTDLCRRAFVAQLGGRYVGIDQFSETEKALWEQLMPRQVAYIVDREALTERCLVSLCNNEDVPSDLFPAERDYFAFLKEKVATVRKELQMLREDVLPLIRRGATAPRRLSEDERAYYNTLHAYIRTLALDKIQKEQPASRNEGKDKLDRRIRNLLRNDSFISKATQDVPVDAEELRSRVTQLQFVRGAVLAPEMEDVFSRIIGERTMAKHGYTRCGFMSLLDDAREKRRGGASGVSFAPQGCGQGVVVLHIVDGQARVLY